MSTDEKQQVVNLLKSIETGNPAPLACINPEQYTQHNLTIGDGLAGFGAALQALPKGSARAKYGARVPGWRLRLCPHRLQLLRPQDRFRHLPVQRRQDHRALR